MNERILDLAFVNNGDNVNLLEPPADLLELDAHHKPFVLCVGTGHGEPGDDSAFITAELSYATFGMLSGKNASTIS